MTYKTIIEICGNFGISINDGFLLYAILKAHEDDYSFMDIWYQYYKSDFTTAINRLVEAKLIKFKTTSGNIDIATIQLNKIKLKAFVKSSGTLGADLFKAYPSFGMIQNSTCMLKNISKKFHSLDEFFNHYGTTIGNSAKKHKEIMNILEWAKQNNLIRFGILEFVASQKWNDFLEMREQGLNQPTAVSSFDAFDTVDD